MAALIRRNTPLGEVATTNGQLVPMRQMRTLSAGGRYQQRSFTAAATQINVANRTEAQRLKKLRQPWQDEAWEYRDAVGELRYATTYLGNAARRMVLVPSAYVPGELNPVPLADIEECPPQVKAEADDALDRLASGGPVALGGMLRDITENFEVAGECYLIGTEVDGQEVWDIRSISEVQINSDGQIVLRDLETATTSGQGEPLSPDAFVARLWWPHPRKKAYADSPFKAILDIAEELLILSRDIRAAGRSRLANNGLLLLPDSLTVVRANTEEDANQAEATDEFLEELIAAGTAALRDEGSAAAILPLIARGPAEALQHVRQLTLGRPDSVNADKRQELITRMATGIDLPAEVLTGKADLNHWTSWQVSDDTFRHHIEPIVMVEVDALTLGYYHPELTARNVDPAWLHRIVLWYDPTNLVTHPDRSADALNAHERMAISDEALRDYMGFTAEDAPDLEEILVRLVRGQRIDPTLAAQIIKTWDPSLDISSVQSQPQIGNYRPGPGTPVQPGESPPEEQGSPTALPASADPHEIREAVLELIIGGLASKHQVELGGPGSGRYPKGSGKGKTPSGDGGSGSPSEAGREEKPTSESTVGTGGRDDISRGMATTEELNAARDAAVEKYKAIPQKSATELEAARKAAAEKHANSKRQGGDDRPNSRQRAASRQALANEFGDGTQCPCVACGRNVGVDSTMSLDRIVPGSDGGSYARSNLVPNCYDCNRVRSNTDFASQPWVMERMAA